MKMSSEVAELFAALSKFQGELDNASKARQGHGYKYADLAECINTAKPFLAKHGLAVSQMLGSDDSGKQTLITMMTHSSGQYMMSEFRMVEAVLQGAGGKNPAQQLGSAITYQRRYAYASIIGLAQEDDDAASQQRKQSHKQKAAFDPDEVLSAFKKSIEQVSDLNQLQTKFKNVWLSLEGCEPQRSNAQEAYESKKASLQNGE